MTTTTDQLEKFRLQYPSIKVQVHDDMLVYTSGLVDSSVALANKYIRQWGLELVAKKENWNTFSVKSINQ